MKRSKPRIDIKDMAVKRRRCRDAKSRGEECKEFAPPQPPTVLVPQPPPLNLTPRHSRAIVTVVVGNEAERMHEVGLPFLEQYAAAVGADLVVSRWPGAPGWPMSAKFGAARVLDSYERIAYLDADTLVRPGAVNLFDLCAPDEFGAVDEFPWHHFRPRYGREHAYIAFRRAYGFQHVVNLPWYFNLGVYVASRRHQPYLLPPDKPLPATHCGEQDWCNARILDAYLTGETPVHLLDRRANWQNWTDPHHRSAPPDAILHWSGAIANRRSRAEQMAAAAQLFDNPTFHIDVRHRDWLRSVLMSGRFRRVLEIGCYRGYSTHAFIDALAAGKVEEVHLCDPTIRREVRVLANRPGVHLHECTSLDLLSADAAWDLVFVDGDHSPETCQREAELLIAAGVPAVFAHDTRATESPDAAEYTGCDGPQYLREALVAAGYLVTEDAERRPGERTDRGMMFAVKSCGPGSE